MKWLTFLFFAIVATVSDGSRILVTNPQSTKSHQNSYIPIVKELVKKGHHITIITNYVNEELTTFENIRQIWMETLAVDPSMFPNIFAQEENLFGKLERVLKVANFAMNYPLMAAETIFGDPRIQKLMASESFDLVMIGEACFLLCYPFGWNFKAPVIALSPNVLFPGRAEMLGDSEQLSYVPFLLSSHSNQMSLYERTVNVIMAKAFHYFYHDWHLNAVESIFKKMIRHDSPSLIEMEKNFSLVFTNSHPTFAYPRPLPTQVIEVGGLHCRPAKQLPEDIEAFVTESEAGFILFAIGSVLRMEDIPEEVVQSFMNVFARLPQRVVWQWKGKVRPDLPKNVLAIPWLPQQDLLGHRNCRAFLTHGGLNSLQEAIYHGVPVLGLPFGSDQVLNLGRAVKEGYAYMLDWKDINEGSLSKAVDQLLQNSTYKTAADRMSSLFRDQTHPPLERAVFWTEFVLRHKGADHLRLGSIDLAPYQRALIDVYVILAVWAVIPLFLSFYCLRKCCFRRRANLVKKNL